MSPFFPRETVKAAALKTTARRDGDHFVVNGLKQFISGAGENEVYAVMARAPASMAPRAYPAW